MTTEPEPAPRPAKPRLLQDGRDMFWSIAPLVVACIVLAGLAGTCSFQLGGPADGPAPGYDAASALHADAETFGAFGLPIRQPALPEGWQANSGSRGSIADGHTDPATGQRSQAVTSTVGYLSPAGMYLSLTQSNADESRLVERLSPDQTLRPTGTVDVDGVAWVVYEDAGGESEPVWTTRLTGPAGATQVAITGAGDREQFRTLAAATQSQRPLPTHS